MSSQFRCPRCVKYPEYIRYHDEERGLPLHDESKHFEMLMLETMQAGLSWWTILQCRENYRKAFANFNPEIISKFDHNKVEELMQDIGIIRNRAKILSAINNAKQFLQIQKEFGSFDNYIWWFTDGKVIDNWLQSMSDYKPTSELSDIVSKDMKKRGFTFVWSTTIYGHLQAVGVINDHLISCFRYEEVKTIQN